MTEFNTGLPSTRLVQNLIKDRRPVEIKLTNGDHLHGKLVWQDHECLLLAIENDEKIILWRHAMVSLKPR